VNKIYRLRPAGARMLKEKSPELDRHLRRVLHGRVDAGFGRRPGDLLELRQHCVRHEALRAPYTRASPRRGCCVT